MKHTHLILFSLIFSLCSINQCSIRNNMFGTDGVRAPIGESPFTAHELQQLGNAIGTWIINQYGENAQVLLGHDTRLSCAWVKAALNSGLLLHPITVIDGNVLPTPTVVQCTIHDPTITCGIIISASHNPYMDNGIKIIDGTQGKLSQEDEELITHYYNEPTKQTYTHLGQLQTSYPTQKAYTQHLLSFFEPNFLRGSKIVLDCAHGATHHIAPAIFRLLGAEVICIGNSPNGTNINDGYGALHLAPLQEAVLKHQADAGFAFDGDGDRVIAVNCDGDIKDGDDVLALLLEHPAYKEQATIVGTIMSNQGLERHLKTNNRTLARTDVGDKYIARHLKKENLLLGGEQSGHTICHDYLCSGDGIFTALRIMQAIKHTHNKKMSTFCHMPQVLINVPIKQKKDLTHEPFASILKKYTAALPDAYILVRYSGTQQLMRVMVEADSTQSAQHTAQQLANELQQALGGS